MRDFLKLIKNKNYLLLWLGQSVSDLGSSINYIGLMWYVMELTGSAISVSGLFIALTIPSILLGPWVGVLVDKLDKKTIIVTTDIIRGLISILMVTTNSVITIYGLVILNGIAALFFSPAINVAIPRLVSSEDLITANSIFSTTRSISKLIGPTIGGALIIGFGAKSLFIINGISFLISAFSEIWIIIPKNINQEQQERKKSLVRDLKSSWEYINKNEIVKFVIIFFAFAMLLMGGLPILNIVLIKELFKFTSEQYGMMMTINGIGFLLASVYMARWGKRFIELNVILTGIALYGLCYTLLTFSANIFMVSLMFLLIGFGAVIVNIAYGTYLQKVVEDKMRGRVFSVDIAIGNTVGLISMSLVGIISDTYGVKNTVMVMGLILFIYAVFSSRLPIYKRCIKLLKQMNEYKTN